MFKSKIYDLDFVLKEGMAVIVSGRAAVYTANGTFQLYCNTIQQEGLGELHIRFERLKEKLSREGYFDAEVKKNLPKNFNHDVTRSFKYFLCVQLTLSLCSHLK